MKAVSSEPDVRLAELAGSADGWRYAAKVETPSSADALAWARATFEGAPLPLRVFLVVGWMALLLEGGPTSDPTHVLGWPIAQATPRIAVLRRTSRLGIHATLLFTTAPGTVTFSSAMTFAGRLGRTVWTPVAPIHRWVVRVALGHAATAMR